MPMLRWIRDVAAAMCRVALGVSFVLISYGFFANSPALIAATFARGLPAPGPTLFIVVVLLAAGGAMLGVGLGSKIAAGMLLALVIGFACTFHAFWMIHDPARSAARFDFAVDCGLAALLLVVVTRGAGRFSIDGLRGAGGEAG